MVIIGSLLGRPIPEKQSPIDEDLIGVVKELKVAERVLLRGVLL